MGEAMAILGFDRFTFLEVRHHEGLPWVAYRMALFSIRQFSEDLVSYNRTLLACLVAMSR